MISAFQRWRGTTLALVLCFAAMLGGCTSGGTGAAPKDAVLGAGPTAPGFIIVGFADENAINELLHNYRSLSMGLVGPDGKVLTITRYGCAHLIAGTMADTCSGQREMAQRVLQVAPGTWRVGGVSEFVQTGFPARYATIAAPLPRNMTFEVGPAEIVYIGDFHFAFDKETTSVTLRRHARDDAAAARALEEFPGLVGQPVVYRDPTPRG